MRIALANLPFPATPDESVERVTGAIETASAGGAEIVCFPEAYVPGYRCLGHIVAPPDRAFLARAWARIADAAAQSEITVVLGTERIDVDGLFITALVIGRDGIIAGYQDKVQLDPSEDALYAAGSDRRLFSSGDLTFGVVICHEGWRYPETVRWAARQGAQLVFHPHLHENEANGYAPSTFGDPANTFHEKAILCRAAENTIYFASVNCASSGSATTSAVANPDGTLLCFAPYGVEGVLYADVDPAAATGLLASRYKPVRL